MQQCDHSDDATDTRDAPDVSSIKRQPILCRNKCVAIETACNIGPRYTNPVFPSSSAVDTTHGRCTIEGDDEALSPCKRRGGSLTVALALCAAFLHYYHLFVIQVARVCGWFCV